MATDHENEDADDYADHAARLSWVIDDAKERRAAVSAALKAAFASFIEEHPTEWIHFERITVEALAHAFTSYPTIVKPVTAICNIAGRAIKRDLGFDLDTYKPRLSSAQANQLAGYVKPFLPPAFAMPAIEAVDDWFFIDKEIRSAQGRWEQLITDALTRRTGKTFKKRKFAVTDDESGKPNSFELDAAYPVKGEPIAVGVDVKRIGAARDVHKRVDEIFNKAEKFKKAYPGGKFGSVIYFPFDSGFQANIINRLHSPNIDGIVFAGDTKPSVEEAILMLIPQLGMTVTDDSSPLALFDEIQSSKSDIQPH